ncbi:carbohydrate ABC transporter permease [Bifidobacterium favimelis]|uniref:Sugar ABC transporter permease n=1 Tax=Bifidobacterium favimelis TaxID=3122979 RepID=A0ABU8ZQF9_9BIFI
MSIATETGSVGRAARRALVPGPSGGPPEKKIRSSLHDQLTPWLYVAIPIIWISVFSLIPFFNTIRLSFTDSTMLVPGKFIGLDNYKRMIHDPHFINAITNSSLYVVCVVPFMVLLPLMLAALVAEKTRIMGFLRTSFYVPVVMSSVVVGLIWTNLLDTKGLINNLFKALHWISKPVPFLVDRWLLLFSAMLVTIWTGLGYYMMIYLASIANIDPGLYEAAQIDGAGGIRQFIHVTLPGCRWTMVLISLLSSMSAFRVFGEIYMLTNGSGGLGGADITMTMLIKDEGTGISARTGYAGAIGMVMFVVLGVLVLVQWFLEARSDDE